MQLRYLSPCVLTALVLLGGAVRADDTLTLELPPSQEAIEARAIAKADAEAKAAAARAAREQQTRQARAYMTRGSLPSRGQSSGDRVVGRLGQLDSQAPIYRSRYSHTNRLTTAPAGTYLAIQQEEGGWYAVLMADGSTGWVSKQGVHLLDYQVIANGGSLTPTFGDGRIAPRTGAEYFTGDPQALLREAYRYLGVPYVWGGNTVGGIDCSGFVKNVFATNGYALPRTAAEQSKLGLPVTLDQLQAGDRLYFGRSGRVTHTGLYIGDGYFIHSSAGQHGVAVSRLTEYLRIFMSARR